MNSNFEFSEEEWEKIREAIEWAMQHPVKEHKEEEQHETRQL